MAWYNPFSWGKKRTSEDIERAKRLEAIIGDLNEAKRFISYEEVIKSGDKVYKNLERYERIISSVIKYLKYIHENNVLRELMAVNKEIDRLFRSYGTAKCRAEIASGKLNYLENEIENIIYDIKTILRKI